MADGAAVLLDSAGLLVHPLLAAPPTLSLWRAPTDNDRIGGMGAQWVEWGLDRLRAVPRRDRSRWRRDGPSGAPIGAPRESPRATSSASARSPAAPFGSTRRPSSPTELSDVARVGTVLETVPGLEAITWFGAGPHETYPDRKRGGLLGHWQGSVTDQAVRYARPQENGGHADVRWLELGDAAGNGLRIGLGAPSQVSATHFRAADLDAARHDVELKPVASTVDPDRRGAPRAGDCQLRPGHPAAVPRRAGDLPLVLDARALAVHRATAEAS